MTHPSHDHQPAATAYFQTDPHMATTFAARHPNIPLQQYFTTYISDWWLNLNSPPSPSTLPNLISFKLFFGPHPWRERRQPTGEIAAAMNTSRWRPAMEHPEPFSSGGLLRGVEVWLVVADAVDAGTHDFSGRLSTGHYAPGYGWCHRGHSYEAVAWWREPSDPPRLVPEGWVPDEMNRYRPLP